MSFGVETEVRHKIPGTEDSGGLREAIISRIKDEMPFVFQTYLGNGGRIYTDAGGIEICTPECETPAETVVYNNAHRELILGGMGHALLAAHAESPKITRGYHYNRVVDDAKNSWGLHDNYSLTNEQYADLTTRLDTGPHVLDFLHKYAASRVLYTGAGRADGGRFQYSQKRAYPFKDTAVGRSYGRTLYSLPTPQRNTSRRFESRDNDNPWSDWSSEVRLAGMYGVVLLMASEYPANKLAQIPLADALVTPGELNKLNSFGIDESGYMTGHDVEASMQAADFQLRVLDILQADGEKYDIPVYDLFPDLLDSLRLYLGMFKGVVRRERPIESVSNWVDWAAKADLTRKVVRRSKVSDRSFFVQKAKSLDLAFDTTILTVLHVEDEDEHEHEHECDGEHNHESGSFIRRQDAIGQKLRLRSELGYPVDEPAEQNAKKSPPPGTAKNRVDAMQAHGSSIRTLSWCRMEYYKNRRIKTVVF